MFILGTVLVFLVAVSICIYATIYKRKKGYAFQKLEQVQTFHDDEAADDLRFSTSKGLLRHSEYRDDYSTSEDELYNTYEWKNGRR